MPSKVVYKSLSSSLDDCDACLASDGFLADLLDFFEVQDERENQLESVGSSSSVSSFSLSESRAS